MTNLVSLRKLSFNDITMQSTCLSLIDCHFIFAGIGKEEMFYLTTHSTHFILRLYGVGYMVKDHSNSERKPAAATWATLSD